MILLPRADLNRKCVSPVVFNQFVNHVEDALNDLLNRIDCAIAERQEVDAENLLSLELYMKMVKGKISQARQLMY